jgi:polygalacturonase
MELKKIITLIIALLLLPACFLAGSTCVNAITVYPLPPIYRQSNTFSLSVAGRNVPITAGQDKYEYAHFLMEENEVQVLITLANQPVVSYQISPKKWNIKAEANGSSLRFSIKKGQYLIVKINSEKELVIAADATGAHQPAKRGKGIFNVLDKPYAADSSGKKLTTHSIQEAINDASTYKNGTVYIPAGIYKVGNIELKSHLNFYLESGAVLLFSGDAKDYTVNARKASQNRNITWWIYTKAGAKDIRLYGNGILDGNGKVATEKGHIGNHILAIMGTENFVLDGLIIRNSGAWAILPIRSRHILIQNFKLFNRFDMGENDGVDVIESQNVKVKHAIGIALDDPFSTKTWKQDTDLCRNWPGSPQPLDRVTFEDCISWTYCYGFKIGQGVMQPQSNITFKDCVVYDAAVGIGIHHKWGTSAVKNVIFNNIDIEKLSYQNDDHRTWAIFFMQNGDQNGSGPISNILVKNIKVRDAGKSPGKIRGISNSNSISHLIFKHVQMPGGTATNLNHLNMTNVAFAEDIKVLTK